MFLLMGPGNIFSSFLSGPAMTIFAKFPLDLYERRQLCQPMWVFVLCYHTPDSMKLKCLGRAGA